MFFGAVAAVAYVTNGTSNRSVAAAPTQTAASCAAVEPLTIGNIMRIYDADQPQPPLTHWTIYARIGADYFVKLISATTGIPKISYYVRGGSSAETDVPTGSYVIKHASGSIWCGEGQYFGPNTVFQKGDHTVSFDEDHTYTLYLTPRRNGNFPTTLISRSQF